jgi:lipopolysaccharide export system protein LptA
MILLFLMVPYEIHSGSMEIVDKNKNIFRDGIEIYSEDLHITAKQAVQTDTYIILKDSVLFKSKKFSLSADYLNYKVPYKIIFGSGNVKIWKDDTLKGDSLVFFREKEEGKLIGNLIFISDSIEIKGKSADFFEDSVVIKGYSEFESPEIRVISDYTVYLVRDSTYKFLSSVNFETSNILGNSGKLIHNCKDEISTLLDKPLILEERDSITGDMIVVDHKTNIMKSLNGKVITYTEDGRNIVWGDTIDIYYNEETIDSVLVKGKSRGSFAKNEAQSGKAN